MHSENLSPVPLMPDTKDNSPATASEALTQAAEQMLESTLASDEHPHAESPPPSEASASSALEADVLPPDLESAAAEMLDATLGDQAQAVPGDPSPADTSGESSAMDDALAAALDAMNAADDEPAPTTPEPEPAIEAATPTPSPDLESAAAEMLDATLAADQTHPDGDKRGAIDPLDDQLASMTAGIMEAETVPPEPPRHSSPESDAAGEHQQDELDDAAQVAAALCESPGEGSTASTTATISAKQQDAIKTPNAKPPVTQPEVKTPGKNAARAKMVAGTAARVAGTGVRFASPVALKLCALISSPLAGKSRGVRDSIGWIGANTLFIACVLWVYLGFIRQPVPAAAHAEAFDFSASTLPQPHPSSQSGDHNAGASAHAKGDSHGAKKPEAKKDDHAKASPKKDAGGH